MPEEKCPICCQPASRPFRRVSYDGTEKEGCIHECHDPYISSQELVHAKKTRSKIAKASKRRA